PAVSSAAISPSTYLPRPPRSAETAVASTSTRGATRFLPISAVGGTDIAPKPTPGAGLRAPYVMPRPVPSGAPCCSGDPGEHQIGDDEQHPRHQGDHEGVSAIEDRAQHDDQGGVANPRSRRDDR